MPQKALVQHTALTAVKSLKTLVENRTVFSLHACELNIFETYESANRVPLQFNDLVITSMLRGKKVMQLHEDPAFDYVPGETVLVPRQVEMKIDFPEATMQNPTQCIALAIDHDMIKNTLNRLNEQYPVNGGGTLWRLDYNNYFFYNNTDLAATISKLIKECTSTCITKDALVGLTLQELIIRIVQTQAAANYSISNNFSGNSPIGQAVAFIKSNISSTISLKTLSEKACMSTTTFYRSFKRELGISPVTFILTEKIKYAKNLLKHQGMNVAEVSYAAGFEDANYFTRLFKKYEGVTPTQFQLMQFTA
ncbi:MAG: AraC family transcriptional regulator [Chitinophagaceae bacterium]|nr:AraC family transcriptional regulator [Chitinophagaceae bacterium]